MWAEGPIITSAAPRGYVAGCSNKSLRSRTSSRPGWRGGTTPQPGQGPPRDPRRRYGCDTIYSPATLATAWGEPTPAGSIGRSLVASRRSAARSAGTSAPRRRTSWTPCTVLAHPRRRPRRRSRLARIHARSPDARPSVRQHDALVHLSVLNVVDAATPPSELRARTSGACGSRRSPLPGRSCRVDLVAPRREDSYDETAAQGSWTRRLLRGPARGRTFPVRVSRLAGAPGPRGHGYPTPPLRRPHVPPKPGPRGRVHRGDQAADHRRPTRQGARPPLDLAHGLLDLGAQRLVLAGLGHVELCPDVDALDHATGVAFLREQDDRDP